MANIIENTSDMLISSNESYNKSYPQSSKKADIKLQASSKASPSGSGPDDRSLPPSLSLRQVSSIIIFAYLRTEIWIQVLPVATTLLCIMMASAPGCPRGYNGPGGLEDDSAYAHCSGGIHRYIDTQVGHSSCLS